MKQMIAAAAKRASTHFISQPQNLFDKLASDARPEQHTHDHPIQEVLNLRHALVPIAQGSVDTVVPLCANCFMYS
jgi:hypothetical protein